MWNHSNENDSAVVCCVALFIFGVFWSLLKSTIVIIQMKLTCFRVSGAVNYVVQGSSSFWLGLWKKFLSVIFQTEGFEHYCPVVLFVMLYFFVCEWNSDVYYFNESYRAVLRCGSSTGVRYYFLYYLRTKIIASFQSGWNPHFKKKKKKKKRRS